MAIINAFADTRNAFRECIGYSEPLTFDEWAKIPRHLKSAFLYVQFYNQITLAWDKANTLKFIEDEDGVSTICQYLEKNVPIIESQPKRFTPAYIYKVAYNCLYCICHDRLCDKERLSNETSSIVITDGKELCLFDSLSDGRGSAEDQLNLAELESEFWSVIENIGMPAEKVMRYLSSGNLSDLKKLSKNSKRYNEDPLRDVQVSIDQMESILEELRNMFLDMPADSECGKIMKDFENVG